MATNINVNSLNNLIINIIINESTRRKFCCHGCPTISFVLFFSHIIIFFYFNETSSKSLTTTIEIVLDYFDYINQTRTTRNTSNHDENESIGVSSSPLNLCTTRNTR
uniref:Uncharacterized protein LOC113789874 n=1 Tax=Dermatophagoides pteronyssinus TaxID=6956 RepID=A0A6P6XTP4_DERPT|nr:uncharacterized protein LOC113789874 [Dermatophagoides pteronyssinus]